MIRTVLPHLRAQGGGRVLQVSGEGGQIAYPGFSRYHATKWGIEGFVEALSKEMAPFGISFTLVEPGPARTNFVGGVVQPEPIEAYDGTPAHDTRDAALGGDWVITGDPVRMVDAMIATADAPEMPLRLALGATSHTAIREALTARIAALDAQREIALSTDTDYTPEELA